MNEINLICSKCNKVMNNELPVNVLLDIVNSNRSLKVLKLENKNKIILGSISIFIANNHIYCEECFKKLISDEIKEEFYLKHGDPKYWDDNIKYGCEYTINDLFMQFDI